MSFQKIRCVLFLILAFCLSGELTADSTWTQLTPANMPADRRGATMAFDQATGQMILFGGVNSFTLFNDTWALTVTNK